MFEKNLFNHQFVMMDSFFEPISTHVSNVKIRIRISVIHTLEIPAVVVVSIPSNTFAFSCRSTFCECCYHCSSSQCCPAQF